jgi:osmoprotectant transport system permease protein
VRYLLNPFNWDLSYDQSIPNLIWQHMSIVFTSLGIALVIAVPVALLVARYRRLYLPVQTIASVMYTIPGLAAIALLVPITGLNATSVIIPLVAYAQVILIRNIVAGIDAVDPQLVAVGRAMGMTSLQLQTRVVLPLALPVIIAGLRVATVTAIGITSVASLAGAGGLGYPIFTGLANLSYDTILGGAILVTALALLADGSLLLIERLLRRGQPSSVA